MKSLKNFAPLIGVALLALGTMIWIAEPLSKWAGNGFSRERYNGHILGKITRAEGSVRLLHHGDIDVISVPLNSPRDLRDGDRVQTSVASKAVIKLESQDEFEILDGGFVQFQLWNSQDPHSPIYVNLNMGELTWLKSGVKGYAYVVKDGRLYSPGQKPTDKPMALTVLKSAPLDMQLAEEQQAQDNLLSNEAAPTNEPEAASAAVAGAATTASGGAEPDTLSNEYIDGVIAGRQALLQKCWLSRLKEVPDLKGRVILQIEITRHGKVRQVKVTDATLQDDSVQKCVTSVIERLHFQSFKGSEISLTYPITFE